MDKDNKKTVSFKISGFSGDVIWYMAGIKAALEPLNMKADLYIWLDRPGKAYEGSVHPYDGVMINQKCFRMLKPLLEAQDYINSVRPFKGEPIAIDMDIIRQMKVGMPYGNLAMWLGFRFPDMITDQSERWLYVKRDDHRPIPFSTRFDYKKTILINRTSRYHCQYISYFFLKEYEGRLMFAGLPDERDEFCKEWNLDIPLLEVGSFLDLAWYIQHCKFFIGNQSMCFAIAEGLKKPRLLEVCEFVPNINPVGKLAFPILYQDALVERTKFLDSNT